MEHDSNMIADAMSSTTHLDRKSLLVSSLILTTLSWGGLVPTKVSALGLEIERVNELVLVAVA
jgi:hypothetical protein